MALVKVDDIIMWSSGEDSFVLFRAAGSRDSSDINYDEFSLYLPHIMVTSWFCLYRTHTSTPRSVEVVWSESVTMHRKTKEVLCVRLS